MTIIHQSAYLTDSLKRTGVIFCKSNITAHVMCLHMLELIKSNHFYCYINNVCRGEWKAWERAPDSAEYNWHV